jgi:hypothetical protein
MVEGAGFNQQTVRIGTAITFTWRDSKMFFGHLWVPEVESTERCGVRLHSLKAFPLLQRFKDAERFGRHEDLLQSTNGNQSQEEYAGLRKTTGCGHVGESGGQAWNKAEQP